jgi:hypothetical protein
MNELIIKNNLKIKNKATYIFLFLSFIAQFIFAQAEFKTSVSKNKLGVNESVRVVFSINKQGADNFSPPNNAIIELMIVYTANILLIKPFNKLIIRYLDIN